MEEEIKKRSYNIGSFSFSFVFIIIVVATAVYCDRLIVPVLYNKDREKTSQ